jgi:hypothetical protein
MDRLQKIFITLEAHIAYNMDIDGLQISELLQRLGIIQ